MPDHEVLQHARTLWDYHRIVRPLPATVDVVIALGCCDLRVAERAAALILDGLADLLVTTGGYGKISAERWGEPEADRFAAVARDRGVPADHIVVEPRAANTGNNVTFTRELLHRRAVGAEAEPPAGSASHPHAHDSVAVRSGVLVCKPYMERRSIATAECQWPGVAWHTTSPAVGFDDYPTDDVPMDTMIALMVGDLQRIDVYASGDTPFQTPQHIPDHVWTAYDALVEAGYDRYVIDDPPAGSRGQARGRGTALTV